MKTIGKFTPEGILISGDQVGTVTEGVTLAAGSGVYMAGCILALEAGDTGKCVKFADGDTPYAILAEAVDASDADNGDIETTGYKTGQFTESVVTAANTGVDVAAAIPALRTLNIHIQPDVA